MTKECFFNISTIGYLRAVDKFGNTIDFYLSKTRNKKAAKKFLNKSLNARQNDCPSKDTLVRQVKYLNNIVEQDHRRVKRKSRHAMGYFSYKTAYNTIRGVEIMHMAILCSFFDSVQFLQHVPSLCSPAFLSLRL